MENIKELTAEEIIKGSAEDFKKADALLREHGETINLTEWLTVKRYCKRFNIENQETVMNWMRRGIIPPENIRVVEELNGLKLIKAVSYR